MNIIFPETVEDIIQDYKPDTAVAIIMSADEAKYFSRVVLNTLTASVPDPRDWGVPHEQIAKVFGAIYGRMGGFDD